MRPWIGLSLFILSAVATVTPAAAQCQRVIPDGDGEAQPFLSGCASGVAARLDAMQLQSIVEGTSSTVLDSYLALRDAGTAIQFDFGVFSDGRYSHTEHDGYRVRVKDGPFTLNDVTPDFDSDQFAIIGSVQGDVSKPFGLTETALRVGVFGGYASNKVEIDSTASLPETSAFNQSGVAGVYVLAAQGPYYGLLTASGILGNTSVDDIATDGTLADGDYDTLGGVINGTAGRVFQLDPMLSLDIRAALSFAAFEGDSYTNSAGDHVSGVDYDALTGNISAGLIGNMMSDDMQIRPYLRVGVSQRLAEENSAGDSVTFHANDDTTLIGNIGLFVALSHSVELNAEVSGAVSEDAQTVAGKLAVKVDLN